MHFSSFLSFFVYLFNCSVVSFFLFFIYLFIYIFIYIFLLYLNSICFHSLVFAIVYDIILCLCLFYFTLYYIILFVLFSFIQNPYRVLEAPNLPDDFYLNLIAWSPADCVAVGLRGSVLLWSSSTSSSYVLFNKANASTYEVSSNNSRFRV